MNELLTRELTNEELSLISGGGESDQADFGLRDIYDYWERQNWSMDAYDRNGDGDGWDEISYTYQVFSGATGAVGLNLMRTGLPHASLAAGIAAAALGLVALGAHGIDTYRYGRNLR
jgi:hypothetical protein